MAISILRLQLSFYTIYTALPTPDSATRQLKFCYNIRHGEVLQHRGAVQPGQTLHAFGAARLPEVASLIRKEQYFVIHAQRQCGKTTAILALRNEINAGGERVAMYCSLEAAEGVADPEKGIPIV